MLLLEAYIIIDGTRQNKGFYLENYANCSHEINSVFAKR